MKASTASFASSITGRAVSTGTDSVATTVDPSKSGTEAGRAADTPAVHTRRSQTSLVIRLANVVVRVVADLVRFVAAAETPAASCRLVAAAETPGASCRLCFSCTIRFLLDPIPTRPAPEILLPAPRSRSLRGRHGGGGAGPLSHPPQGLGRKHQ